MVRVDIADVVQRALDSLRSEIDTRKHDVVVEGPENDLIVNADAMRFEQVVTNLLSNAVKYTPPDGRIAVKIERRGQEAVLTVVDNGLGMDREFIPTIFTLFVQAERSLDRHTAGLGLGLALVSKLVELHHGKIEAFSEGLGKGSRFVLTLPALPPGTPAGNLAATEAPKPTAGPRKVLVVDDNVDAAESTEMCLRLDGHDVKTALDGASAIRIASEFKPDIAFIDIGLPDIDGYEVARRLRASPDHMYATLVALSGYGQEEHISRSKEAGFDFHLVKPADLSQIEFLIAAHPPARLSNTPGTNTD
ncbi:PAS/PAC sensor hybrid histidine kinase [Caballeronia terrestris]|uniref:histidine kinase n=2 Tax=Caballeronia terrestris TaxID=1226301 RepID=A0A158KV07_9BURK|nr:PAS/PAC sensor hybrid histidine kinase [Caballeronia terrestris]